MVMAKPEFAEVDPSVGLSVWHHLHFVYCLLHPLLEHCGTFHWPLAGGGGRRGSRWGRRWGRCCFAQSLAFAFAFAFAFAPVAFAFAPFGFGFGFAFAPFATLTLSSSGLQFILSTIKTSGIN